MYVAQYLLLRDGNCVTHIKLFGEPTLGSSQVDSIMHKDHAGRFMCKSSEEHILDTFTRKVINTLVLVT